MQRKRTVDIINESLNDARKHGIVQLTAEDTALDGRTIRINGKQLINFSSCGYLGLDQHPQLKRGGIEAIQQYGSQFSCSRAYMSMPLYRQLEDLLSQMFHAPVLVVASTTLGHLSILPCIIHPNDVVFLDQYVHASVRMAANQLAAEGTKLNIIRHARLYILEKKIQALQSSERKIWFLADGVYSMFGGFSDITTLKSLMDKYKQLHLYIDDAHGMSWTGKHGTGSVWDQLANHDRLYLAISLNKAFAAGGGALVLPNEEVLWKIRSAGSTFIFSGPLQPPLLGAGIASAKIHLSDEIKIRQADLIMKLEATRRLAQQFALPAITKDRVPIQYIGVSHRDASIDLTKRLMNRGFYTNAVSFPAVNSRHTGVRFTIHHHLQIKDIEDLFAAIAEDLPKVLKKYGISREQVDAAFALKSAKVNFDKISVPKLTKPQSGSSEFRLLHSNTMASLKQKEWDSLLGHRGNFDSKTLLEIEKVFAEQTDPINYWQFHYFVIRDQAGKVVLMTFFTEALLKSDMLTAEAEVSKIIEAERQKDPLYLTSAVLSMGCPITEGNHLYLDMHSAWQQALTMLLNHFEEIRRKQDIKSVVFRDLDAKQETLITFLRGFDFLALPLPNSWQLDVNWQTEEQYLQNLSKRQRKFQKDSVTPFDKMWHLNLLDKDKITEDDWQKIYQLYRNVQQKALTLNTFPLPLSFFQNILNNPDWEIWTLSFKSETAFRGFYLCQKNGHLYNALILGINYDYVLTHGLYRQILARIIKRGKELGCTTINLGLGTNFEKSRHGAKSNKIVMLVQSFDQYQNAAIEAHRVNQNFV